MKKITILLMNLLHFIPTCFYTMEQQTHPQFSTIYLIPDSNEREDLITIQRLQLIRDSVCVHYVLTQNGSYFK